MCKHEKLEIVTAGLYIVCHDCEEKWVACKVDGMTIELDFSRATYPAPITPQVRRAVEVH